ncbi:Gfo/Idh/MocA family protein [Haloplasma contractile]|uniref:D-xylose 1-dehydrogenase protein n=1 Tax=Haloplasma contractile SSD-17B TaxID=1033810 RepID=U2DVY2_9MOLU|nr:Gfo/Idh/MocA family oxidoreductase [Haloplasma contractile]ERJ12497.1 D-xylose 1-dehydrogenase protein [Haloplasma contractile SSD-17B]
MKQNSKVKWGIIGTGMIASQFAKGLKVVKNGTLEAVASRTLSKAETFKEAFSAKKAHGSYEELAKNPDVDVIYIGTPHTYHKENMILCIENGKHVLCEKPFTLNANDAKEVIDLAKKHKVFLMEAMWTKFLPTTREVKKWVNNNLIGKVQMLQANFGFRSNLQPESRLFNPNLGGGSLLDVGIYPVTYTTMFLGLNPDQILSVADIGETGVDEQASILLKYKNGSIGSLNSALRTDIGTKAIIYGTDGQIEVDHFFMAERAKLIKNGEIVEEFIGSFKKNGYEYEAEEVGDCILNKKLESDVNPLKDTVSILEIMDKIRFQWKLKYPTED